ncbi:hypothetical protein V5738_02140 [Salinisphaera sp. SPP-AMP-43]|uniref:hypothetical protein n=1 Tax=Salinisphaera sp. SPP-AMP-43 TaxID=3121288 RepID=UPI003C6E0F34
MNRDAPLLTRRYGTPTPEAEPQPLTIGRTSLLWQAGTVRRLCFDGIEILRGLSMVIRDAVWGTHRLAPIASYCHPEPKAIRLGQESRLSDANGPVLNAAMALSISETRLEACLHLTAEQPFDTCRSGLVVLLPLAPVVGRTATVVHDDGSTQTGRFEERISPAQPFFSIRRLSLAPTPNIAMTLDFQGDVFEMEDQRNWSDASFKIYNRPLAWPSPYRLAGGECIEQRITLTVAPEPQGPHHD